MENEREILNAIVKANSEKNFEVKNRLLNHFIKNSIYGKDYVIIDNNTNDYKVYIKRINWGTFIPRSTKINVSLEFQNDKIQEAIS